MSQDTRDPKKLLLDAAISFMREGHSPTTRELTERAGVNLAAINYYFQGKDNLMAQALDDAACADLDRWFVAELGAELPLEQRLLKLCLFLGRIHRSFAPFSHLQLKILTLEGRPERATAKAIAQLAALIAEQRALSAPDPSCWLQATTLMSSLHYLSIFHAQFSQMTRWEVETDAGRDAYVLALLKQQGLLIDAEKRDV